MPPNVRWVKYDDLKFSCQEVGVLVFRWWLLIQGGRQLREHVFYVCYEGKTGCTWKAYSLAYPPLFARHWRCWWDLSPWLLELSCKAINAGGSLKLVCLHLKNRPEIFDRIEVWAVLRRRPHIFAQEGRLPRNQSCVCFLLCAEVLRLAWRWLSLNLARKRAEVSCQFCFLSWSHGCTLFRGCSAGSCRYLWWPFGTKKNIGEGGKIITEGSKWGMIMLPQTSCSWCDLIWTDMSMIFNSCH